MRYKLVGLANIIIGGFELVLNLILLFMVYPKLMFLYQDMNIELPFFSRNFVPIELLVIFVFCAILYIGLKLFFTKAPSERLYKAGVIGLVLTLGMLFLFTGISILSVVNPFYSLTRAM